jgi:hypothetical protein
VLLECEKEYEGDDKRFAMILPRQKILLKHQNWINNVGGDKIFKLNVDTII